MKKTMLLLSILLSLINCSKDKEIEPKTHSLPEPANMAGKEFGKMIEHSISYLQRTDVLEIAEFDSRIGMIDQSIVDYFDQNFNYSIEEKEFLLETIASVRESIATSEEGLKSSLSEQQTNIARQIMEVASISTIHDFESNVEVLYAEIEKLPINERDPLYYTISFVISACDALSSNEELMLKSAQTRPIDLFACNVAAGMIGAVYGAVTGVFCGPCGIAVGILTSAAVSTVACK